ncbi:MAG TPA: hypothetical protein DCK93_16635 [Blastocatellia bacterium]|nr:hypothetical protein [Blastocatellia bacterium]
MKTTESRGAQRNPQSGVREQVTLVRTGSVSDQAAHASDKLGATNLECAGLTALYVRRSSERMGRKSAGR